MQALARTTIAPQRPQQHACRASVPSRLYSRSRASLMIQRAQPTETEAVTKEQKTKEEQEEEAKKQEPKKDPLEEYCEDNPETDECRVYED
ncbi:hypothetical protein CVIRNUC_004842 [Coccomyxa viridis]|uniref:Uncharacterized protein n=1 Tax=Coccomyxa viridis TaxID=1274662 RepID=A0AAV1I2M5_9CHLO|nr:hypothetical protein CVIRNUC_004842 [Coccomyxa viridis]